MTTISYLKSRSKNRLKLMFQNTVDEIKSNDIEEQYKTNIKSYFGINNIINAKKGLEFAKEYKNSLWLLLFYGMVS